MFDPSTLATLATFSLPLRTPEDLLLNPNIFQDFSNGGYFYLDNHDQVVTATTTQHIYVIGETAGGAGFALVHDYDLSSVLTSEEEITSALPDSNGLLWFVARRDGVVGTLDLVDRWGPRDPARQRERRGDRELVRHRSARWRVHRDEPQAVPVRRGRGWRAARSSGRSRIRTAASRSPARSTTARVRPRR